MDPAAIEFAEKAFVAGAVPDRVTRQLELDFEKTLPMKALHNKKQKMFGKNIIALLF